MEDNKSFSRKKFVVMTGLGIAGFALLRKIPTKLFAGRTDKKKLQVKIHTLAVKRENRGSIHG